MSSRPEQDPTDDAVREAAARWMVRRDRGLSSTEAIEFECWLAASPLHAKAFARAQEMWRILGRIPDEVGEPIVAAARPTGVIRRFWPAFATVAAAAAVVLGAIALEPSWRRSARAVPVVSTTPAAPAPRTEILADGTMVRLNAGAEIVAEFTERERSVRLRRGEAYFSVTKNPNRPFVVYADNVTVRAVGTAFNVNLQRSAVDVLVAEGIVHVRQHPAPATAAATPASGAPHAAPVAELPASYVEAGHRAVVHLDPLPTAVRPAPIEVTEVDPVALHEALAWREPLLKLGGATLAEVAVQFEQLTGHPMKFAQSDLAALRIGGFFPGNDPDGFVRVLEDHYGIRSRREADGTLVLERSR